MNYHKIAKPVLIVLLLTIVLAINANITKADNSTENTTLIIDSILDIYDTSTITPAYANTTILFFANYSYQNGSITDEDLCKLFIQDNEYLMLTTNDLHYYDYIFEQIGNYAYTINCFKENYENLTDSKTIEILEPVVETLEENITIDNDNDGYTEELDCDDNNANINPGMHEIFYNGIDDDCNPGSIDYLIFDITTNKQSYNPGDTVNIVINATNHSDTYITINTPSNVSYVYIFDNGTYPVAKEFSLTGLFGLYSIEGVNYYGEYTNTDIVEFTIENTLEIDININKDEIFVDEDIQITADIIGNNGNVNMIWNMDDGNERYDETFEYSYNSPGTYNIVLIATDQGGNQIIKTRQITVLPRYYLTVKVIDNSTDEIIPNATVKLDSDSKIANESGMVRYLVKNHTYDLKVTMDNYYTYKEELKINESLFFTVYLIEDRESFSPNITLISPNNNSNIENPEFKFKFIDDSNADCILYLSEGDGWWEEHNRTYNITSNKEYLVKLDELENRTFYWKVECIDEDDNRGYSDEFIFSLVPNNPEAQLNQEQEQEDPTVTFNEVQTVYDLIPEFETYSPDEKKIVEYLKLDIVVKNAKKRLDMANRDLYNLRYQPDTASAIEKRDEIIARIDEIKKETPQSVTSKKKVEFVKYVDDSDVEELFEQYINLKNLDLSKSQKKKLIEQNILNQKKVTIETTAYSVEITTISGDKKDITLIRRDVQFDLPTADLTYVEFIPKNLVESTKDIKFVTEIDEILAEDPVFEISASKLTTLIYYIEDSVSLDNIPKIKPVVFSYKLGESSENAITGLAIFDNLGFSSSNKLLFIIEILIVFTLLGVYLFFYFRTSNKQDKTNDTIESQYPEINYTEQKPIAPIMYNNLTQPNINEHKKQELIQISVNSDNAHKISYIKHVIIQANGLLNKDKLNEAALKYYEVKFLYDTLNEPDKEILYSEIIELNDKLSFKHIQELVEEAIIYLAQGEHDKAHELYNEVQIEYEKLSEHYKNQIYSRCCELALHLRK